MEELFSTNSISWLPAPDVFPVAIAGLVAYSTMNSLYDFTEDSPVTGTNHRLSSEMDLWLFSAILATNFSVLNFYGGISYLDAVAETKMLGKYDIVDQDAGELIISL